MFQAECLAGNLDEARKMHETHVFTPDEVRSDDCYALKYACVYGHLATAQWLKDTFGLGLDARAQKATRLRTRVRTACSTLRSGCGARSGLLLMTRAAATT